MGPAQVDFIGSLLGSLGAPDTPSNRQFLQAWMRAEGSRGANNPLATTKRGYPGERSINRVGVKSYPSPEVGVHATADTLRLRPYQPILEGLQAGTTDPRQLAAHVAQSPWGTGRGVMRVLNAMIPAAEAGTAPVPTARGQRPGTMDVRLPNGKLIRGVPRGTTKAQLSAKLKANGIDVPDSWMQVTPKLESPELRKSHRQVQAEKLAIPLTEVGRQAAGNLGPDLLTYIKQIGSGLAQAGAHPLTTAQSLGRIALGAGEKAVATRYLPGMPPRPQTASERAFEGVSESVKAEIAKRFGSWGKFKASLAREPVQTLADISAVLPGLGVLAAAGNLPRVAKVASVAGRALDPLAMSAKVAGAALEKGAGPLAAKVLGVTTSLGEEAPKAAWRRSPEFMAGMRSGDQLAILEEAKDSVSKLRQQRGAAYRAELAKLKAAQAPIDPRRMVMRAARDLKEFGVEFLRDPTTGARVPSVAHVPRPLRAKVAAILKDYSGWTDFTPLGLDRLKRNLDSFYKAGEPEAALVSKLRNIVKSEIERQVPAYRQMTRDYAHASQVIEDIEKALSTREGANIDTALRKLGTLHRDINWYRKAQMDRLGAATGRNLSDKIAGAQMHDLLPRGQLSRFLGGTDIVGGALLGHPGVAAASPLFSPRAVGEALSHIGPLYRGAKAITAPVVDHSTLMYQLSRALANPYGPAETP